MENEQKDIDSNNREENINNNKISQDTLHIILPNRVILLKTYNIGKFLGKGLYSKCYEYTSDENKNCITMASKIIPKRYLFESNSNKDRLINEIKIHKSLNNEYIVLFKEYHESKESIYIFTELCKNQTLEELIQRRKKLTEMEVQYYLIQLIIALNYLKSQRIIHRDLHLSNIFLADKLKLKLGDFSNAIKLNSNEEKAKGKYGNPNYMAPEMIEENYYSYEVDIWALGIIIYKLIIGKYPFESKNEEEIYNNIKKCEFSFPQDTIISEDAKDLIKEILVKNPEDRPSLLQIISHDFFKQLKKIPKSLPQKYLYEAPDLTFIKHYVPNVGKNLIVQRPHFFDIYVKKWVDFSSKYGVGYLLNNGCYGSLFNDKSIIILNQKQNIFFYKENEKEAIKYNLENYPKDLEKKIEVFQMFQSYLDRGKMNVKNKKNMQDVKSLIYLENFQMEEDSTILKYSNGNIHFFFIDNSEIIISKNNNFILYMDKNNDKYIYPLKEASELLDKKIVDSIKSYL